MLEELKQEIAEGSAVFFLGTGVSVSISGRREAAWKGLLEHGIQSCLRWVPALPANWQRWQQEMLDQGKLDEWLSVADAVTTKLGGQNGGNFRRWLRKSVGALTVADAGVGEALAALGAPLVTTNYDSLLKLATRREPITWREDQQVQLFVRGTLAQSHILHLHGYWGDSDTVILGIRSYDDIVRNELTQTALKAFFVSHTVVFVGYGAGLDDPNFEQLRTWVARVLGGSESQHYRLCLESEVAALAAEHRGERIVPLAYGAKHADLEPFLRGLAPPRQGSSPAGAVPASVSLSVQAALKICVGLTKETELTIDPSGVGAGAILRITRGDTGKSTTPALVGSVWRVTLPPGEYIVTVDRDDAQPRGGSELSIEASAPVSFISAPMSPVTQTRSFVAWSGTELRSGDPVDPWPSPPPEASIVPATSPILGSLRTLADATSAGTGPERPPAIHALLIGIDDYPAGAGQDGQIYRSLRGCVRDVTEVEKFLVHEAQVPPERVTRLITSGPPASLPTYANIVTAWKTVIAHASRGDIVYVHYSGHGGRARTLFPAIKHSQLDESIAPYDINDRAAGKYLRDVEIAALLASSAKQGLLTTLVLDSCHSGSATRGDEAQARRGDWPDEAPRADQLSTSLVASVAELEAIARELERNPRGLDVTWQLDGAGTETEVNTVIAACRQHESAYEYDADDVHRWGALTYFWLETLRQRHAAMTYRDAHRQVFARVQGVFTAQSPLLLGAADRLVFGTASLAQAGSIAVLSVAGDQVELAAGRTGLIEVGTRLAMIPHDILPEVVDPSQMTQVDVISIGDTTSTSRIVEGTGTGVPITLGSRAIIVSYAPRIQRIVRLLHHEAPPGTAAAFAELERQIQGDTQKLVAIDASYDADYLVAIDPSRTGKLVFAILDRAGVPLPHLSEIAIDAPKAAATVKDRLVHLTRYSNVLNLTNNEPSSTLANKLELSLHAADGERCNPAPLPERPAFKAGTSFYIRIKNRSVWPMNVAVFDLTSHWSIKQLPQTWGFDSGEARELRLTAELHGNHTKITDILKVIATRNVAAYDWMTLPSLDAPAARGDAPRRAPENPFEALMKAMQAPEVGTRSFKLAAAPTSDWMEGRLTLDVVR